MRDGRNVFVGYLTPPPAKMPTLRLGPLHPKLDPFRDAFPLEFRYRPKDVELKTSGGRCGIDTLGK